ncbi:GNAT family N-acetyltransferase [Enterococcus durans]|uniref:GNAT family N-acetyltransferase n=1 Tax=Enterococcus durans TaxID=53345 RepID=UPI003BEF10FB
MIRKVSIKDAKYLRDITAEELGYDVTLELMERQIKKLGVDEEKHFIIVYEKEEIGIPIGYVHAELYESIYSEPMFNVLGLAVTKHCQTSGVGRALMEALEEEAKRRNLVGIRLNSSEKRMNAHQFYENIGYISDKKQKRFLKVF